MSKDALVPDGHPPNRRTFPPFLARLRLCSHVSTLPTASITTSAPSPLVSSLTLSTAFSSLLFIVTSAPSSSANLNLSGLISMTIVFLDPEICAKSKCINPIGPAPIIATVSPRSMRMSLWPLTTHENGSSSAASTGSTSSVT